MVWIIEKETKDVYGVSNPDNNDDEGLINVRCRSSFSDRRLITGLTKMIEMRV